jgi:hypothetical protein
MNFVCFSGHLGPRQLSAIEEAGKIVNRVSLRSRLGGPPRGRFVSASSACVSPREVWRSPFWPDPIEHGGARDTSVAYVIDAAGPEVPAASLPEVPRPERRLDRFMKRMRHQASGYWGAPAKADPVRGDRDLQERLSDVFPKLQAVWEGSNPNSLFRSYYSILPPNRSFFRAWLLFACVLALMLLWMALTVPRV